MSAADHHLTSPFVQTALPLALASALMAGIAQQAGLFQAEAGTAALYEPQVAVIPPRTFQYRADGERSVASMSPLVRIARPPAHLSGTPEAVAVLSAPRPTISDSVW